MSTKRFVFMLRIFFLFLVPDFLSAQQDVTIYFSDRYPQDYLMEPRNMENKISREFYGE